MKSTLDILATELFENANFIASIYYIAEDVLGSLGIMHWIFPCLISLIEVRMSNFECGRAFVCIGMCSKALLVST